MEIPVLALSPQGHLYQIEQRLPQHDEKTAIETPFVFDETNGLLHLGFHDFQDKLSQSTCFWQKFSQLFISHLCIAGQSLGIGQPLTVPAPSETELINWVNKAPCMTGGEYLNTDILRMQWHHMQQAVARELADAGLDLDTWLQTRHPKWAQVGRVCFHLAENKSNPQTPFAFLATFTTRLSGEKPQHVPLGRALNQFDGQKEALLALLLPVHKAAEQSTFLKSLLDSGDFFQTLMWSPRQAHTFLQHIPIFEAAGIVVRVPNWWSPKKPSRAKVEIKIGGKKASTVGINALLDFEVQVTLPDGHQLDDEDWQRIVKSTDNLVFIKGQWTEVDRDKLQDVLQHWKHAKILAREGVSFAEAMRLLAGRSGDDTFTTNDTSLSQWSNIIAGDWLKSILEQLRDPNQNHHAQLKAILEKQLRANLRPYQQAGLNWLWLLYQLKLGGCLADDMGLGKTIQILSLFLLIQHMSPSNKPHLLVVPASLIGNWINESSKFAPSLRLFVAHSSVNSMEDIANLKQANFANIDVIITTYQFLQRTETLQQIAVDVLVLDEAQLIKNPGAKQTRAVKAINSQVRFVLTGTPVENRLSDLWSLFDCVAPGLLGSAAAFKNYGKKSSGNDEGFYASIRSLVSPYLLRRLKNDKRIIRDLPDKTEIKVYCSLSKQQAIMYQQLVDQLAQQLETTDGMQRRGLVLSYLTRFKQVCNHPDLLQGYGEYPRENSGKLQHLQLICEEIAQRQEKVLVFTQFREAIPMLNEFLQQVFGQPGLQLHGQTPVKERGRLVERFTSEQGPPFFVLSIKAGGTGLNLTAASHVIHFDRWWNPAVENQATDRAYRIGQHRNVLVHKLICKGTIEEKIDALIESKKMLSEQLLSATGEINLTELSNEDLMRVVSLDIRSVLDESENIHP